MRRVLALLALLLAAPLGAEEAQGNFFVLAQLKTKGDSALWDPYPLAARDVLSFLQQTTSVKADPERRVVQLSDPTLFQSPFLLFIGSGRFSLSKEERETLKRYLAGGGFLFVEDQAGEKGGLFDHSFRAEMKQLFPDRALSMLPKEHAVFRSFYLLRSVGGRKITGNYLEGVEIDGRTALVYSQNDVMGAWAKDLFGNYLYACEPGGEAQRWEAQKLMMNIILYSVTGTYKTDAIHLPFIEDKLRR